MSPSDLHQPNASQVKPRISSSNEKSVIRYQIYKVVCNPC